GNNGGDAFVAGRYLLKRQYEVAAITLFEKADVSSLSSEHWEAFLKAGGTPTGHVPDQGVLLDGLLGTGFTGAVKEPIASLIEKANRSKLPILAIDIPSGLNGNDGTVSGPVIQADLTLYLGLPKAGFFLGSGMDYIGKLLRCDFGLDAKWVKEAKGIGCLVNESVLPALLPPIKPSRHKYEAGYILAVAGSPGMMGAAHMACMAAYRTGAGIIRLFQEESAGPEEIVHSKWDEELFVTEQKRAKALIIGPGMGRAKNVQEQMVFLLKHLERPAVIDADGLFFLAHEKAFVFKTPVILTPHRREMMGLLGHSYSDPLALIDACQQYAETKQATVVLKGAPTFVFHPGKPALIMPRGGPGLAKAGTGDVLTGIIAAYLAQGLAPREAAILGSWMHALAGEQVVSSKTDYGLIATDLIEVIPEVLAGLI
ncbi:MAG: NAD(P)H-hydrate dehydratase, partial [Chlamydiia bacterium]|nr:NAD(P)H-hydrate dehydratase [Chlamydiia bacterium]